MLINRIFSLRGDLKAALRRRVMGGGLLLTLGGLALVAHGLLVPGSGLPEVAKGFYLGIGGGLVIGSTFLIACNLWLLAHPEQAKVLAVRENDEREKAADDAAAKWSYYVSFFVLTAALLLAAPLSLSVFFTLLGVFFFMALCLGVCMLLARKRM